MAGPIAEQMLAKLQENFQPESIDLVDQSHLHKGHAGHDPRGESHFKLKMRSAAFAGQSRVNRQRLVHAVLKDELSDRVHALSMILSAPDES